MEERKSTGNVSERPTTNPPGDSGKGHRGNNGRRGTGFWSLLAILLGVVAAILLILTIYFALRPRPVRVVERAVTATPLPTPLPQVVPPTSVPIAPTVTNTPTSIFATSTPLPDPPTTPLPRQTVAEDQGDRGVSPTVEVEMCQKGGVAWHNPNQPNGELFGEATLGEADENCWLVGQIWTDRAGAAEVWVFAIAPGATVTFADYRGGIAWFFVGDRSAVEADLEKQERELRARDSQAEITQVFLPDEANRCRLVVAATSR